LKSLYPEDQLDIFGPAMLVCPKCVSDVNHIFIIQIYEIIFKYQFFIK
jgi:uncharacterized membrane protein